MGDLHSITCKNKSCRYHKILRHGPGMRSFCDMMTFRDQLLHGEVIHEDAAEKIRNGARINMSAAWYCPVCREITDDPCYYLMENFTQSPFGTIRYDVSFPFGLPRCKCCGTEMSFIKNVLSSKVKCPKCGSDLSARLIGSHD